MVWSVFSQKPVSRCPVNVRGWWLLDIWSWRYRPSWPWRGWCRTWWLQTICSQSIRSSSSRCKTWPRLEGSVSLSVCMEDKKAKSVKISQMSIRRMLMKLSRAKDAYWELRWVCQVVKSCWFVNWESRKNMSVCIQYCRFVKENTASVQTHLSFCMSCSLSWLRTWSPFQACTCLYQSRRNFWSEYN